MLRYPRQATFHPLKYLRGLFTVIEERGGLFFADSPVIKVEELENSVRVVTDKGNITARERGVRHELADQ